MQSFAEALKAYTRDHPFDAGNGDTETVLDQLYQAYAESHESDPPEISEGFKELECFLETLPLSDNNAVFNLCCRLCTAYEEKAFRHGLIYGATSDAGAFHKGGFVLIIKNAIRCNICADEIESKHRHDYVQYKATL